MATINVTVTVDTANVAQDNLKTTVVLTDDHPGDGDGTPGDSETFTIHADKNNTVQFTPAAKDGTTQVTFNKFEWENKVGNDHCFDPMPAANNSWTGTAANNGTENFSIKFTVQGKGTFLLDPEIVVKQGGGS